MRCRQEMTVILQVKVKPRAKVASLDQVPDGTWIAKLRSPPVDGKANEELEALIAKHFRCRRAAVSIKSGAAGHAKLIVVDALSEPGNTPE